MPVALVAVPPATVNRQPVNPIRQGRGSRCAQRMAGIQGSARARRMRADARRADDVADLAGLAPAAALTVRL